MTTLYELKTFNHYLYEENEFMKFLHGMNYVIKSSFSGKVQG